MKFNELATTIRAQRKLPLHNGAILALDPGETTGWAIMKDLKIHSSGQLDTKEWPQCIDNMSKFLDKAIIVEGCKTVVMEDYRVYAHKLDTHTWSNVHTTRFIGAILTLMALHHRIVPIKFQMAAEAKSFCKDTKLKEWGFYQPGMKHARDAIRHICTYVLFDK